MKHIFLVGYDYGTGGIWRYLTARSRQQIESKYPELRVFDSVPDWMDESLKAELMSCQIDIDDPECELFNAILNNRNAED